MGYEHRQTIAFQIQGVSKRSSSRDARSLRRGRILSVSDRRTTILTRSAHADPRCHAKAHGTARHELLTPTCRATRERLDLRTPRPAVSIMNSRPISRSAASLGHVRVFESLTVEPHANLCRRHVRVRGRRAVSHGTAGTWLLQQSFQTFSEWQRRYQKEGSTTHRPRFEPQLMQQNACGSSNMLSEIRVEAVRPAPGNYGDA